MESSDQNSGRVSKALACLKLRRPPPLRLRQTAMRMLASPDGFDRTDLVRLVALEPLMSVWILKRANSSYYGLRSTVDSVSRAIDVLESETIIGMFSETAGGPSEYDVADSRPEPLTAHAVATAVLAAVIDASSPVAGAFAFTSGLLHDVGKHVFALSFPEETSQLYRPSALWESLRGSDLLHVEQLAFGLDHREVGEFVARKMLFPESLTDVLRGHVDPSAIESPETRRMAHIVGAASLAATGLGYEAGDFVSWEQCALDSRWEALMESGHTNWPSAKSLLTACRDAVATIEDFLQFGGEYDGSLMKSDNRTKRTGRAPSAGTRSSESVARRPGSAADTQNNTPAPSGWE